MTGPADALSADERLVQPEFTGTAAEYFRIWIVKPLLHARDARDLFRLGEGPQAPVFLRQHATGRG